MLSPLRKCGVDFVWRTNSARNEAPRIGCDVSGPTRNGYFSTHERALKVQLELLNGGAGKERREMFNRLE